jgi:hypothetical protein
MGGLAYPDRIAWALGAGILAALYWWYASAANPQGVSDFDQHWVAARVLLSGGNPYIEVVGGTPGPLEHYQFRYYYPLPAALMVMPLVWLPVVVARAVLCALTFGALAFLLTKRGPWPLVALLSAPLFQSLALAQWSLLLAVAVLAPAVTFVGAGKPNAWLAVLVGSERVSVTLVNGTLVAVALCAASFWFLPTWVGDWLATVRTNQHNYRPLIMVSGGWVLLGALTRFRDPRARWLLATALLPGTPLVYTAAPLMVYEWPRRRLLLLALLSHLAMWPPVLLAKGAPFAEYAPIAATATLWLLYVPAMLLLLTARSP